MNADLRVTLWIDDLQSGSDEAAAKIWERYSPRVLGVARKQLSGAQRRATDEEDVAQEAFLNFCNGAADGRFKTLNDRRDLWNLLRVITKRTALDHIKHERRKKRGGGQVCTQTALRRAGSDAEGEGVEAPDRRSATPDENAHAQELWRRLIGRLPDEDLRKVAGWKLSGYSNDEIAEKLACSESTVFRRLHSIRKAWDEANGEASAN